MFLWLFDMLHAVDGSIVLKTWNLYDGWNENLERHVGLFCSPELGIVMHVKFR